jgi:amidohydrolase
MARLIGGMPGRTVAVRADIDALPIQEENAVPYRSTTDGVMHACGHDGHTSMLLGLAQLLATHRDAVRGEVRFFFQHAEELAPGGAEEMIAAGVMAGVEVVIGVHLWSQLPTGQIGLLAGAAMAAPDTFTCTITGRGGHAALPHDSVDPIAVGAQVVTALQQVVSRQVNPLEPLVVSVTQFHAGTTDNVIPNSAMLSGTIRTFDATLRDQVPSMMERVIRGVCEAHGATFTFSVERGYRPVVNDPAVTAQLRGVVTRVFGGERLAAMTPLMVGEDFSAYQQHAPGVFAFIGSGNPQIDSTFPHHHPQFDLDEAALTAGLQYLTAATVELLG